MVIILYDYPLYYFSTKWLSVGKITLSSCTDCTKYKFDTRGIQNNQIFIPTVIYNSMISTLCIFSEYT